MYSETTLGEGPAQRAQLPIVLIGESRRIEERLKHLIASTLTTAPGRALRRAVQSVGWLVTPLPGKSESVAELSVRYVALGASVGEHSARLGLGLMLDVIGHAWLTPSQARAAGFELRLLDGGCRGRLRVITPEARSALESVSAWLDRESIRVGSLPGVWTPLRPQELRARGYDRIEDAGRRVRCPMHNDSQPSLVLFGAGADRGAAFCHGGCGAASWTTGTDGQRWARSTAPSPPYRSTIVRGPGKSRLLACCGRVRSRPACGVSASSGAVLDRGTLATQVGYLSATRGKTFERRWGSPVLESLCWADIRSAGPAATRAAYAAASLVAQGRVLARSALPDSFLSASPMRASSGVARAVHGGARTIAVAHSWEPDSQEWVLVDLDDFAPEAMWDEAGFAQAVATLAEEDPRLSGRMAAVRTSDTGLQVWLELTHARRDARAFWRAESVRVWYAGVSGRLLAAARSCGLQGGRADATAAAPGRYGRKPGWRLVDGLWPFRSRVIAVVADASRPPCSSKEARRAMAEKSRKVC